MPCFAVFGLTRGWAENRSSQEPCGQDHNPNRLSPDLRVELQSLSPKCQSSCSWPKPCLERTCESQPASPRPVLPGAAAGRAMLRSVLCPSLPTVLPHRTPNVQNHTTGQQFCLRGKGEDHTSWQPWHCSTNDVLGSHYVCVTPHTDRLCTQQPQGVRLDLHLPLSPFALELPWSGG